MITEAAPEGFQSEVHMTEYGTDDYSEVELEYPGRLQRSLHPGDRKEIRTPRKDRRNKR